LWFLVTLVPVIGIVQVGTQSFADRYTYICSIGLSIIVVWGLGKPAMRLGFPKIMGITAAGFIVFFSLLTWKQTQHWGSSELLWRHTLEVTGPSNTQAWTHLAGSLFLQGREDEARRCFEAALKTGSNDVAFHTFYGLFLLREGKLEQAISHLEEAVRQEPQRASIQTNLAAGLFRRDRIEEACACSRRALQIDPHYAPAYYILGLAEVQLGKDIDEALACLRQAVRLDPVNRDYRCALGCNLQRVGLLKEAASEFQEAFQLDPNWPRTFNRNAAMLIEGPDPGKRNTSWAIYLAETVCFATGGREASYLKTLAAALAEDDRYEQALATARQALARAVASGSKPLVESLKARIAEYEQKAGRPDRRQQRQ
jgi:tetratricopeptide (TPR) repeat protein